MLELAPSDVTGAAKAVFHSILARFKPQKSLILE